ncbi:retron St85 family RNA-directed DNA polymerase [Flavobacterium granuli]|uniref:RNA-directed DNA polymerase n=1 Tax=Flavobacterium granuli TaxID=280093 RepID=A0A1M5I5Z5_9FLAO|nr:retron St85 family RNA-directed DNA polymerase [Flavobacterium granuli]PRZ27809.1 RNA-directed DNA polymerase [Flavobacterium granuli]SHG23745.1 RNA-directed DNA polymerase [Flavobacterium granuli]
MGVSDSKSPHSINDSDAMDFVHYKDSFTKEALKIGYSQQNILSCLDYAQILLTKDVPVIYNSSHLAVLVGYKKEYLKKAAHHTKYFYRDFEITKKNGKKRPISEPLPSLMEIQHWILKEILYKLPVSPFAKAYRPNISIIENLKFHKNQPKVFTLDLENFFPSIKIEAVERIFTELGYSKNISNLLAQLCTRDGRLPQGAPTSPFLSNLIFKDADLMISDYCKEHKIRYTRYADDLSFSGDFDEKKLLHKVTETIEKLDFKINAAKTKLMTPDRRQTVTGIVVNEKPQVVFHKRNTLRQTMYYIKKFGIDEHREFKEIDQTNFLEHLLGQINFVLQINPKDSEFIHYKAFLIDLKKKQDAKNIKRGLLLM